MSDKAKAVAAGTAMLFVGIAGIAGLFAAPMLIDTPAKLDPETLCPVDAPIAGHVALLVDRTDPYDETQRKQVASAIHRLKETLPVGGRLSVHLITDDASRASAPVLDLCNPGEGSQVDPLVANPRRVQKRFEEEFANPVADLLDSLMSAARAERSPILEAITAVAVTLERDAATRIVVVSDLLQNSAVQSHYRTPPDVSDALDSKVGKALTDGRLKGVTVELKMLANAESAHRQGTALKTFWSEVLSSAGAEVSNAPDFLSVTPDTSQ